jgi:hypothetical protein
LASDANRDVAKKAMMRKETREQKAKKSLSRSGWGLGMSGTERAALA